VTDELVNVRYVVDDVDEAVTFHTTHFGFTVRSNYAPAFADIVRGHLIAQIYPGSTTNWPIIPRSWCWWTWQCSM
jgi:hypothetical protein